MFMSTVAVRLSPAATRMVAGALNVTPVADDSIAMPTRAVCGVWLRIVMGKRPDRLARVRARGPSTEIEASSRLTTLAALEAALSPSARWPRQL